MNNTFFLSYGRLQEVNGDYLLTGHRDLQYSILTIILIIYNIFEYLRMYKNYKQLIYSRNLFYFLFILR